MYIPAPPIMVRQEHITTTWISYFTLTTAILTGATGVNWGTMASHQLPPSTIVRMLKDNYINKVKLFDSDPSIVTAFAKTNIELILGIPNNQLSHLAKDYNNAKNWITNNITQYLNTGHYNIKYIAVGNEPFLQSYNGAFMDVTLPALKNIHRALIDANIAHHIKPVVPLNADVYNSPTTNPLPSAGNFRSDIHKLMLQLVHFLNFIHSPFIVNIYPFLSLYQNPNFPINFAFFDTKTKPLNDSGVIYTNVFDANLATLKWSIKKAGVLNMQVIIGEIGWPTDGYVHANVKLAKRFYIGFLSHIRNKHKDMQVYIFSLMDEDLKSVLPGNFERHWGIFTYDGKPKFELDLSGLGRDNNNKLVGAKGVEYLGEQWCVMDEDMAGSLVEKVPASVDFACSNADCTELGFGCSCEGLDQEGNVSYAFNAYFQSQDQDERACDFQGLAKIVKKNASRGTCVFPVQIVSNSAVWLWLAWWVVLVEILFYFILFYF
ncbi:glucan endo-1,3-beta-glucosidase 8-like [Dioscorea cayenensis subsp. rotundata]|uniref:glucan endo-1,3-beta-D-glucosidase n=1 Tax=Dioscorea cayennensis subsp. rotundata TaxID=55577 RepID=A0AB40ARI1_DIOCR|nr:glucan endo-1,3-beta-glucosidase 8-like [Dioscorea cayenensis subsp. rotundata]